MKEYIKEFIFSKKEGQPKAVWNGLKTGNQNETSLKNKRGAPTCPLISEPTNSSSSPTTTTTPPTTAAPSMPSCYLQNTDPDAGINEVGCICGSTTLPLLTVTSATDSSQSCSYTALPSSSVSNPISIETQYWTINCQACTLVGGFADTPTCTSVAGCTPTAATTPTPTFVIFLSNNSVPVGNANNKNNGSDLRTNVYNQLRALCPDNVKECNSENNAEIDNIPTVIDDPALGNTLEYETLTFTIQDSYYNSPDERDLMLAASVASWQQAVARSCKEVEYKAYGTDECTGDNGPVKRDLPTQTELEKRCVDCDPVTSCGYRGTICSGPDHISKFKFNYFLF